MEKQLAVRSNKFNQALVSLQYREAKIAMAFLSDAIQALPGNVNSNWFRPNTTEQRIYKKSLDRFNKLKNELKQHFDDGNLEKFRNAVADANSFIDEIRLKFTNHGMRLPYIADDVSFARFPEKIIDWLEKNDSIFTRRKVVSVHVHYVNTDAPINLPVYDKLFGNPLLPFIDESGTIFSVAETIPADRNFSVDSSSVFHGNAPKTYYCIGTKDSWKGTQYEDDVRYFNEMFRGIKFSEDGKGQFTMKAIGGVLMKIDPNAPSVSMFSLLPSFSSAVERTTFGVLESVGFLQQLENGSVVINDIPSFTPESGGTPSEAEYAVYMDNMVSHIANGAMKFISTAFYVGDIALSLYQISVRTVHQVINAVTEAYKASQLWQSIYAWISILGFKEGFVLKGLITHAGQGIASLGIQIAAFASKIIPFLKDLQIIHDVGSMMYLCTMWGSYISSYNAMMSIFTTLVSGIAGLAEKWAPFVDRMNTFLAKFRKAVLIGILMGFGAGASGSLLTGVLVPMLMGAVCNGFTYLSTLYNVYRFYQQGNYGTQAWVRLLSNIYNVFQTNVAYSVGAQDKPVISNDAPLSGENDLPTYAGSSEIPTSFPGAYTLTQEDVEKTSIPEHGIQMFFGCETTSNMWADKNLFVRRVMRCHQPDQRNVYIAAFIPRNTFVELDGNAYVVAQDVYNRLHLLELETTIIDEHHYSRAARDYVGTSIGSNIYAGSVYYAHTSRVIPFESVGFDDSLVRRIHKVFHYVDLGKVDPDAMMQKHKDWREKTERWARENMSKENISDQEFDDSPFGNEFLNMVLADPMTPTMRRGIHMLLLAALQMNRSTK